MNGLSQAPSLQDVLGYAVNKPGQAEVIGQSLYDFQLYPAAGAVQFNFFQNPVGQGLSASPGNAGNTKTLADTNMRAAGQLPAPQMFLCTNIQVLFEAGSVSTANTFTPQRPWSFTAAMTITAPASAAAMNDFSAVIESGWLQVDVGSKNYLQEAKLNRFPPKAASKYDFALNGAVTQNVGALAWGQAEGQPYPIDPPILLPSNQAFQVSINFPVAIATPSTFNGRIGVVLDGYLYRSVQ